jgi:hypothetical protein
VELSRNAEGQLVVAVFQNTNNSKALSWSKAIDWKEPYPGWSGGANVGEVKALVTRDGKTVVLRDWGTPEEKNGLRIIGAGEKEDHRLETFDRMELTGASPRASRDEYNHYPPLRSGVTYYHAAALLDFIIDEEGVYAIWFGQTDQWLLISLKDFKETIVKDEEQLRRLNEEARARAAELVLQHQPTPLRRAVNAVQAQVGKIFPSLAQPQQRIFMTAEITPAYLFLAARKKASDKGYIENLVTFPTQGVQQAHPMGMPLQLTFTAVGAERVIGDFLLAKWNGETNRDYFSMETYIMVPDEPSKYLGMIRGSIELPIKIFDSNAGNIWAYLIPARVPVGKWNESDQTIPFSLSLNRGLGPNNTLPKKGEVAFKGILPGEYRVKFVWERHPGGGMWRTNMYTAVAGDYESAESGSIVVKAGETVRDISVLCTNRIGDGKAYEEDDGIKNEKKSGE